MSRAFFASIALLLGSASGRGQDAPKAIVHDSPNPTKCKTCVKALNAAYVHLEKPAPDGDAYVEPYMQFFLGFLYLVDGKHPKELQRAVTAMSGGFYKRGGFNGNWSMAMSALFLSEVYKRMPNDKLRGTLLDLLQYARANQEPTGGWCHHLGYAQESGYDARGGGVDLGIVTAMMFSAMLNMKKAGVAVDAKMIEAVQKNLEGLTDGMGISYGTNNAYPDVSMARGGLAFIGLHAAKLTTCTLYETIPRGLAAKAAETDAGHAYAPLHFFGAAVANHLCGPEQYQKFATEWVDKLIALQQPDGSLRLPHREEGMSHDSYSDAAPTATFALLLLLQQPGVFEKGVKAFAKTKTGGGSVFSEKQKPWLGLRAAEAADGVEVKLMADDSPAQVAGLEAGDLIVEAKGATTKDAAALKQALSKCAAGQKITLVVMRGDEKKSIELTLGEKPDKETALSGDGEDF